MNTPLPAQLATALTTLTLATAQATWTDVTSTPSPSARAGSALAYDSVRHVTVLFGGRVSPLAHPGGTWTWDGQSWTQVFPASSPAPRENHVMAYDAARDRVVLFGGTNRAVDFSDTWEWDGNDWLLRSPTTSPPTRVYSSMAFDSQRQRIVVFGGVSADSSGVDLGDTWEWDGNDWHEMTPTTSPPPGLAHAMTYDAIRGCTVLFGGENVGGTLFGDTWEWDGIDWSLRAPALSPSPRSLLAMGFDAARGVSVLFGGRTASGDSSETWEWDGSDWLQRNPASPPPSQTLRSFVYQDHVQQLLVFGSDSTNSWHYSFQAPQASPPMTWSQKDGNTPQVSGSARLAFDSARDRTVLFGGRVQNAWEWDGVAWLERPALPRPIDRATTAMAFDEAREKVVLFGGNPSWGGLPLQNDTWTWDGTQWLDKAPASAPPARDLHAMAYDRLRQRVVLYGGLDAHLGIEYSDTWEWDGSTWTQITPTTSPPALFGHSMAWDPTRSRVILRGGSSPGPNPYTEWWEWDGTDWTRFESGAVDQYVYLGAMAFDAQRSRMVQFGGGPGVPAASTWEFDGVAWTEETPYSSPPPMFNHGMAYDSHRQRIVVHDWQGTWEYEPVNPATSQPFGLGCLGSSGVPELELLPGSYPLLGSTLELSLTNLPPSIANVAFGLIGFSNTDWGSLALPVDLAVIGAPSCLWYTSSEIVYTLPNLGGHADWDIVIPDDAGLLGRSLFLQGAVFDFGANPLGITSSAGRQCVVGELL